jgi:hypothetical protein
MISIRYGAPDSSALSGHIALNCLTEPLCHPAQVGTRSRLIRSARPLVMSGVPPRMVDALWRVRRRLSGNASVDVLRRTRRNAYTIKGAAPDTAIGRPVAVRTGARPYRCIGIA